MFNRTIRIFLSSTFKDMVGERDYLHRNAFRKLREQCEAQGFQFHVIDLRWGVTQEAAWDQRTESLCLEEIRRCQQVTPRPNFVALIGQRYGWRPLPEKLSESDWKIVSANAGDRLDLLQRWYLRDENNAPLVHRLRHRGNPEEREPIYWTEQVEIPLRELFLRCLAQSDPAELSRSLQEVDLSLTEKEILLGVKQAATNSWQAFAYFRELEGASSGKELGEPWVDLDAVGELADPRTSEKLKALREWLEKNEMVTTRSYPARVENGRIAENALRRLDELVEADLKQAIDMQIKAFRAEGDLDREVVAHQVFSEQRRLNYVSRANVEARIHDYLGGASQRPLILHGASGAGKTALLATLWVQLAKRFPRSLCIARFIGATGQSSSLRSLIRSIHAEAAQGTASKDVSEVMQGNPAASLRAALAMANQDKPVIVLLDALDQLSPEDYALSCGWIPRELPEHCHLIATCMTGQEGTVQEGSGVLAALAGRLDPETILEVTTPSMEELKSMFSKWLAFYGRVLTGEQLAASERALAVCPRPLFLRVLVELARSWTADTPIGELPTTTHGIIEGYLDKIEHEHGRTLVARTLGLLAASRSGLTEVEVVELLSGDVTVLDHFRRTSRYEYPDARNTLPPAVWSRLFFDLEFLLGDTTAAGVSLLHFYHRQLAFVAKLRYCSPVAESLHESLSRYFYDLPIWYSEKGRSPNTRRAYELPFQLRTLRDSESTRQLSRLLTDEAHVAAKIESGLAIDLLNDYFEMELVNGTTLDSLVFFFVRQYLTDGSPLAKAFEPGDLHSFFAYRGQKVFYDKTLRSLAESERGERAGRPRRIQSRARVDLGGMLRRRCKFDEARAMLQIIEEEDNGLSKSDLGVAWYEIGYLYYVLDEYPDAANAMHQSVEFAEADQDSVGAAISRSIELWSRYFQDPVTPRLHLIVKASRTDLALFTERQNTDPRALRWVMNALAHLVNATHILGHANQLREYLRDLRANPWIRAFESKEFLLPYEARLAMSEGRFDSAIRLWEESFKKRPIEPFTEGGAWLLLDYGISLARLGRRTQAQAAFSQGLELSPRGANNAFWQKRIRQELAKLQRGQIEN